MNREAKTEQNTANQEVTNNNTESTQANEQQCEQDTTDNMTEGAAQEGDNETVLSDQANEWQDKYIRLSAEFDNYRRRTLKEKMELIESAGEDVIKSVLTVVDDFDRAIAATTNTDDIESLKSGIALIHKRLVEILKQKGVSEIESMGAVLDTDFHDAIAKFPVEEEDKKGKVIDVVEKGYKLKDKVIRFSKVVVGE